MGVESKLPLQLFQIGFCLFCSKIGKRKVYRFHLISGYCLDYQRDFYTLSGNPQEILAYRVLSHVFFKSKIPLGYRKILKIVSLIII